MDKPPVSEELLAFDLVAQPGHLLRRNHQRSLEIFTRVVGNDVTRQQVALLIALAKRPGSSQRDLVDDTGIDKSTLKEMIGRMVTKGWLERARDPADNRAWTMKITPAGQALIADKLAAMRASQEEILAPLPEHLRASFISALRILVGLEPPGPPPSTASTTAATE